MKLKTRYIVAPVDICGIRVTVGDVGRGVPTTKWSWRAIQEGF